MGIHVGQKGQLGKMDKHGVYIPIIETNNDDHHQR